MSFIKRQIPILIATNVICLAIGAVGAILTMLFVGYRLETTSEIKAVVIKGKKDEQAKVRRKRSQQSFALLRLTSLISKLDVLTTEAPQLKLTPQQQTKLADQLKGLDEVGEWTADEAKARYEAITEILKDHQDVLRDVGILMPGEKLQWPESSNPFAKGRPQRHLESLRKRFAPKL